MAISMHSHSGQFCPSHAKDQLEEVIQRAISLQMRVIALTEHMPRNEGKDLYPEEIKEGDTTSILLLRHVAYVQEAARLREKYKDQIKLVIGFEGEWIRPAYAAFIADLLGDYDTDFFIGSVHHVHEIPIDYDQAMYDRAREVAGGADARLFEDYFDAQHEMLLALKPRVVGHFDLIRLLSDEPDQDLKALEGVWERIMRNLSVVVEQGGLLEINSSALRKGLKEPYPTRSVCEEFLKMGGKFTLSDDSHGVAQVGLNFGRTVDYLKSLGVETLHYLERGAATAQQAGSKPSLLVREVLLADLNIDECPQT